ncbi:MAG: adenylate/guanylate cyclase domain-containing protein [Fimbriimonadaceae bacterium]
MPSNLDSGSSEKHAVLNEEAVQEALLLAEQVKGMKGLDLDDDAIAAVSQATGAPSAYVRAALLRHAYPHPVQRAKSVFLSLEPDTRRHVVSGFLGTNVALLEAIQHGYVDNGFYGMAQIILVVLAAWNLAVSKESRTAALSGAIFGGLMFAATSLFALMFAAKNWEAAPGLLIPYTFGGAFAGLILHALFHRTKGKWAKNPSDERQELLRQMVELQAKLDSGKRAATFLSLDVIGSTRMKEIGKPLEVEYTFNEYHAFVDMIARRHGGAVHSTAGDGVICAFDSAQQAFQAAKNIQTGVIELNTFRNKIGIPIKLRAGIHSGDVMAPGSDLTAVNFAHVIDMAAHLQKACPEGGIAISQFAAVQIPGGPMAIGPERVEVSGIQAVIWQPRTASPSAAPGIVPPPPPSLP